MQRMYQHQKTVQTYRPLQVFKQPMNPQNQFCHIYYKFIFDQTIYVQKIKQALVKMANGDSNDDAILRLISDNAYKTSSIKSLPEHTTLLALKKLSRQQNIKSIFSRVAKFILDKEFQLKKTVKGKSFPLIKSKAKNQYTFKKSEILLMICLMSMCLTVKQPRAYLNEKRNFFYIFSNEQYKTRCILQYLDETLDQKYQEQNEKQKLTIKRIIVEQPLKKIIQQAKKRRDYMQKLVIKNKNSSIDDKQFNGNPKVDFANKMIGGGALGRGLVQQEIMFSNHPQLYASTLICEAMKDNQSLIFIGFKKYFKNKGYARDTQYQGKQKHRENYSLDSQNRRQQYIIAIDAIPFDRNYKLEQFTRQSIDRQILKAYTGFTFNPQSGTKQIVSGNWGCGAFNGDLQLKLLIQWIAASLAGKKLIYCPFGRNQQVDAPQIFKILKGMQIYEVYQLIISCFADLSKGKGIYLAICKKLDIKLKSQQFFSWKCIKAFLLCQFE